MVRGPSGSTATMLDSVVAAQSLRREVAEATGAVWRKSLGEPHFRRAGMKGTRRGGTRRVSFGRQLRSVMVSPNPVSMSQPPGPATSSGSAKIITSRDHKAQDRTRQDRIEGQGKKVTHRFHSTFHIRAALWRAGTLD